MSLVRELKTVLKEFDPPVTQLRAFGLVCGGLLIGVYVYFSLHDLFAVAAIILLTLASFAPHWLLPLVTGLIAVTYPIGWLLSGILLILFYCVLLTIVGFFRRVIAGSAWRITDESSYWKAVEPNQHHDRMSL